MTAVRCMMTALNAARDAVHGLVDQMAGNDDLRLCHCDPDRFAEGLADPCDALIIAVDKQSLRQGLELCRRSQAAAPLVNVVMAGAGLDRHDIVTLLAEGAIDYIALPASIDEVIARVFRAAGCVVNPQQRNDVTGDPRLKNLIGCNPAFVREVGKIPSFANCEAGVLIFGATGTGKEICAQAIHYLSPRSSYPCVAVNCGAIPTELIEAELFGHVRGAYTSALHSREGLVREAEGGTLFLDDVDGLPAVSQAKLLRFLQEREYRKVGSNQVQRADVRVIAASNRRLDLLIARGEFRPDLYFRLNVLTLNLPPLCERRDDIALIARHFVRHYARASGRPVLDLAPDALARLLCHEWPGNVRELMHVIERAVLMASGHLLTASDLQMDSDAADHATLQDFQSAKRQVVRQFERGFLESLLRIHAGNVTHAAQASGKNRRAFFELMRKHGIKSSAFRPDSVAATHSSHNARP